jgi:putative NIF3 family GTP cyclohydrolase 1 type 2
MSSQDISRRSFARIAGALAAVQAPVFGAGVTAQDIVKQIQGGLGGDWPATGVDGFKAGKPETEVRGIATTAMATVDVLRKASKAGLNLIISHEPTFFGSRDGAAAPAGRGGAGQGGAGRGPAAQAPGGAARGAGAPPQGMGAPAAAAAPVEDPVQKAKNELIAQNGLVVFRLRDHWRARKENDMATGLADSLGWASRRVPGDMAMYDIPSATLSDTVAAIRKKLDLRGGLRAVGDPKSKVKRVMLYPGAMDVAVIWKYFEQVDLIVAGEVREWECVPYAEDMNGAGEKRSLVTVGRVASEDPGMKACAAWLKTVVKGVPVQWISAGDPYWRAV